MKDRYSENAYTDVLFTALHICRAVFATANVSVRKSVRLSARLSVTLVNCDKTKAPSEKSSIMTNRKSPTSFPMSLKGCLYYDTCTAYMCAAHVRRTCAMTVYTEHARCFQHV